MRTISQEIMTIQAKKHRSIYLSLGTNLGNREENLERALAGLEDMMQLEKISAVYETAPWGPVQDQASFFNLCASGTTQLEPLDFLDAVKELEKTIGRLDGLRWGPRLIDIDLLFYEDVELVTERLIIPHKEVTGRAFVLVPLADIAPNLMHPSVGETIQTLMNKLTQEEIGSVVKTFTVDSTNYDSIKPDA